MNSFQTIVPECLLCTVNNRLRVICRQFSCCPEAFIMWFKKLLSVYECVTKTDSLFQQLIDKVNIQTCH